MIASDWNLVLTNIFEAKSACPPSSAYDGRMDLVHFLKEKLHVADYLYENAAPLFEEIHRKISEHAPPYIYTGDPEDLESTEFQPVSQP